MTEEKDNSKLSSTNSWMDVLYPPTPVDKQQPSVFYNLVNQPNFLPIDFEPFIDDHDKEYIEKLYQRIKEKPINVVLGRFVGGLKPGEMCYFSSMDKTIVIDSLAILTHAMLTHNRGAKQKEQVEVMPLKVRKALDNLSVLNSLARKTGKTISTMIYLEQQFQDICKHFDREPIPTQDDFPYSEWDGVDKHKAEFKKSPLERLNKKKAVKTATVSPLLKGLMGKT
jgi:hypothetical protein